jgi:putative hemin transport protein
MQTTTAKYAELKQAHPHMHTRDAAERIGISEAELVAALPGATRLRAPYGGVLRAMPAIGRVKTMTRNAQVVIERWGVFEQVEADEGPMGQVVGVDIDLRLFFSHWGLGVHLVESGVRGDRHSFQFFDRQGDSIHKIYAESPEVERAFGELAARERASDVAPFVPVTPTKVDTIATLAGDELDSFRAGWDAMQNTHEFFGLLRRTRLERVRALELAGPDRAREVGPEALRTVLHGVAAAAEPIMVFVGNRGAIQIHTGLVEQVVDTGGYLNVLDAGFNLHVRDGGIARAFVVRKPTADGIVTSLELYDASGENVALVFSKRKPGQIEAESWRDRLAALDAVGARA